MLTKIVLAVVVGIVVTLVCLLAGTLFLAVDLSLAVAVGAFLKTYAAVIGLLAALWHFFKGGLNV